MSARLLPMLLRKTLTLFKGRLELEGRYEDFLELQRKLRVEMPEEQPAEIENIAAERMGCVSYEDEKARLLGMRATNPELVPPSLGEQLAADEQRAVKIRDDLDEAYNKSHKAELPPDAFLRPGAYIWYRLAETNPEKFCTLVAQHVLKNEVVKDDPRSPEEQKRSVEEDARLDELSRMLEE